MTTNLTYNYVYTTDDEVPVSVTVPVITSDMVIDTIIHHKDWSFYHASIGEVASDTPELDRFISVYREWLAEHQSDNDRICKAWLSEYNPIHNYDRNEDSTDTVAYDGRISENETGEQTETYKGPVTRSYGAVVDTYTNAERNTTTKRNQGISTTITDSDETSQTTDTSVSTYDSNNKPVDTATNTGTASHSSTQEMSPTNANVGDSTITASTTDTVNRGSRTDNETQTMPDKTTIKGGHTNSHGAHEYGNIGVTTTQQMIAAEYDLRIRALALRLLDNFCREKLFLLGEDEENDCYFLPYGF